MQSDETIAASAPTAKPRPFIDSVAQPEKKGPDPASLGPSQVQRCDSQASEARQQQSCADIPHSSAQSQPAARLSRPRCRPWLASHPRNRTAWLPTRASIAASSCTWLLAHAHHACNHHPPAAVGGSAKALAVQAVCVPVNVHLRPAAQSERAAVMHACDHVRQLDHACCAERLCLRRCRRTIPGARRRPGTGRDAQCTPPSSAATSSTTTAASATPCMAACWATRSPFSSLSSSPAAPWSCTAWPCCDAGCPAGVCQAPVALSFSISKARGSTGLRSLPLDEKYRKRSTFHLMPQSCTVWPCCDAWCPQVRCMPTLGYRP